MEIGGWTHVGHLRDRCYLDLKGLGEWLVGVNVYLLGGYRKTF